MTELYDVNLNDYEEPQILPDGSQTQFRVLDAELKSNDTYKWIQLTLQPITDEVANPAVVYHSLFLPRAGQTSKEKNTTLYYIKKFCDAIGYEPEGGVPKTEEMMGKEGVAILKISKDEGYEARNQVRKFVKG